jgi:hypothetical protein
MMLGLGSGVGGFGALRLILRGGGRALRRRCRRIRGRGRGLALGLSYGGERKSYYDKRCHCKYTKFLGNHLIVFLLYPSGISFETMMSPQNADMGEMRFSHCCDVWR